MRVFFGAIELVAQREHLELLRAVVPQEEEILGNFNSIAMGKAKSPVVIGKVDPFIWKVQPFPNKVIVRMGFISKAGMTLSVVLGLQTKFALPAEISFRPVVDQYSDRTLQEIIDRNIKAGRPWVENLGKD